MYDPIIKREEFPKFSLFASRPAVEPGVALVLFREDGETLTLMEGYHLTAGQVAWGRFKGYYKVDIGLHSFSLQANLPCNKDAFNFRADIQVTFQVFNPTEIVKNQIHDSQSYLQPELINLMRNISRKYTAAQSEEAEQEIIQAYGGGVKLGGFQITRVIADLELDSSSREHLRKLDEITRTRVEETAAHELHKQRDQFDIERKQIKMDFYGPLIQRGQWEMLGLHLAEHPDDVATIAQMLTQQRQLEYENQLKMLKVMLDNDVIEGFQLEETSKQVLKDLVQNLTPIVTKTLTGGEEPKKLPDKDSGES